MKSIYSSHVADPNCGLGENCPMMVDLKKRIEEEEKLLDERNFSLDFGLK